jgi:hypothetical protein
MHRLFCVQCQKINNFRQVGAFFIETGIKRTYRFCVKYLLDVKNVQRAVRKFKSTSAKLY